MRTIGVGGSEAATELANLRDMAAGVPYVEKTEYLKRIKKAQGIMQAEGIKAVYLNAGSNLYYSTGMRWYASERMVGAILPALGSLEYVAPYFEIGTLEDFMLVKGPVNGWQEHESPYDLTVNLLKRMGIEAGPIGVDETTAVFIYEGLRKAASYFEFIDAKPVTAGCRIFKSDTEIAIMQHAKNMTLEVHKAAARILYEGITTSEVEHFINEAHKRVGAPAGYSFCIVLFGEVTAFPHGVKDPQTLKEGDIVLIDTGCVLQGYNSDITRTYVFGEPSQRQRFVWDQEKAAQQAAFDSARIGASCSGVDNAARRYLEAEGYGPDYNNAGFDTPHGTWHWP